jgi:hypothetical protein
VESTDDSKSDPERYFEVWNCWSCGRKEKVTRGAAIAIEFDGEPAVDEDKKKTNFSQDGWDAKRRRRYYAFPELRCYGFESNQDKKNT